MPDLVALTGTLRAPNGLPLPNTPFTCTPKRKALAGRTSGVQVPRPVSGTSDGTGAVTLSLEPGNYVLAVETEAGRYIAPLPVPVSDAPLDIGGLIDGTQVPEAEIGLPAALAAVNAAVAAADTAISQAGIATTAASEVAIAAPLAVDAAQTAAADAAMAETARVAAEVAAVVAETVAGAAQASARTLATWAALADLTGAVPGEGAEVLDADTGTHTDPVAGGTVPNAGRYSWSASPAGWRRVGDTGLSARATFADVAGFTTASLVLTEGTASRRLSEAGQVAVAFLANETPPPLGAFLDGFGRYDLDGRTQVTWLLSDQSVPPADTVIDPYGRYDDGLVSAAVLTSEAADVIGGTVDAAARLVTGFSPYSGERLEFTIAPEVDPPGPEPVLPFDTATDLQGIAFTATVGGFSTLHLLVGSTVIQMPPGAPSFDAFNPDLRRNAYVAYRSDRDGGAMREWRTDILPQRSDVLRTSAVEHWLGYGQSNAMTWGIQGSFEGQITTGVVAPGRALSFNGSVYPNFTVYGGFNPTLQASATPPERLIGFARLANETPANPLTGQGLIDHRRENNQVGAAAIWSAANADVSVLVSGHGVGGAAYVTLRKGTQPYANVLAAVTAGAANAARLGLPYRIGHVDFVHGESDFSSTTYQADIEQLMRDLDADASVILGRAVTIPWFASQALNWTAAGIATARSPLAQLALHEGNPGKYHLYLPGYAHYWGAGPDQSPPSGVFDIIHNDAYGVRLRGEYLAKARAIFDATGAFDPLRPVAVTWDGTHVWVDLTGRVGNLQWNVYNASTNINGVADPGSYGFRFCDAAGAAAAVTISAISIVSNRVRITPSASPVGLFLGYADIGTPGAAPGPLTGPRGCLSDSDTTAPSAAIQAFRADPARHWGGQDAPNSAAPLVNWCVAFRKPIE